MDGAADAVAGSRVGNIEVRVSSIEDRTIVSDSFGVSLKLWCGLFKVVVIWLGLLWLTATIAFWWAEGLSYHYSCCTKVVAFSACEDSDFGAFG